MKPIIAATLTLAALYGIYPQTTAPVAPRPVWESVGARAAQPAQPVRLTSIITHAEPAAETQELVPEPAMDWSSIEALEEKQAALEARISALEGAQAAKPAATANAGSSGTTTYGSSGTAVYKSYGSSGTAVYSAPPTTTYKARWQNYDGLTKRQHAETYHGLSTASMNAAEIAMALDHDHDSYGGSHPPAMRSRTRVTANAYGSDCPGGVCPTTTRATVTQSRGGLFGFGVLGRRR